MPRKNNFQLVGNPFLLPENLRGAAVAIGNFDGFHRGHQKVLADLKAWATLHGTAAIVLSFEPHPRDYFRRQNPLLRITGGKSKAILARALGLDGLVILEFDEALSRIEPVEFVKRFLIEALGCAAIFVGDNFRFGRNRAGDVDLLHEFGATHGFECHAVRLATDCHDVVSSTRVRAALSAGQIDDANAMLGFRWFFEAHSCQPWPGGRRAAFRSEQIAGLAEGEYHVRGVVGPWPIEGVAHLDRQRPGVFDIYFPADMPPNTPEPARLSLLGKAEEQRGQRERDIMTTDLSDLDRAIGII